MFLSRSRNLKEFLKVKSFHHSCSGAVPGGYPPQHILQDKQASIYLLLKELRRSLSYNLKSWIYLCDPRSLENLKINAENTERVYKEFVRTLKILRNLKISTFSNYKISKHSTPNKVKVYSKKT